MRDTANLPPLRRLANHILQGKLDDFVASRRAAGRSWRLIERDLLEATKGQVDVTHVTLRAWFPDLVPGNSTPPKRRKRGAA